MKTTFGELASSVGKVTPIAANLGITTNELFSSLASTTAQGLATSESVTALKAAMSNIIKPSKEASEAAEMLGIDFSASAVKSKGWIGFLKDIKEGLKQASPEFANTSEQMTTNAEKLMELERAGKKGSKEYKELSKANKNLSKDMEILAKASDSPLSAFSTMFGSVEGLNSVLMLTSDNGMSIYNDTMKEMTSNTTALDDACKAMEDTRGERFKKSLNSMKISAIKFGDSVGPIMEKGSELISTLADKLGSLSKEQMDSIVHWGTMALATGGALKITGKAITSIGNVEKVLSRLTKGLGKATKTTSELGTASSIASGAGGLGTLSGGLGSIAGIAMPAAAGIAAVGGAIYLSHKHTEYLNGSCLKSKEELSGLEKVFATLNGKVVKSADEMDRLNIKHKKWSDEVSPETQKELDSISKKVSTFNLELQNVNKHNNLVNPEISKNLDKTIDEMCTNAINKIQERSPEVQKALGDMFNEDGVLDENETKILESLGKMGQAQIDKVNNLKKEILEIKKKAIDENRQLSDIELAQIDEYTQEIGRVQMQNTVKSQDELLAAQADFNARMKNLDMDGVIELLQEKAKARDEEYTKINDDANKKIELLKLYRDQASEEDKGFYDERIKQAENERDQNLYITLDKYKKMLQTAKEKYPELAEVIDQSSGKILNNLEQDIQKELKMHTDELDGIGKIYESGYYKIKNTTDNTMHDCYVSIDYTTGEIQTVWDQTARKIWGNPIAITDVIKEGYKNGDEFKPIYNSYKGVKDDIWSEKLKAEYQKNPLMFQSILLTYGGVKRQIQDDPITALCNVNFRGIKPPSEKWTGTNYFNGGLTYMHEKGYELYDLPKSTRIFNHEASQDLVMKSAESVASKVANRVLAGFNSSSFSNAIIEVPVVLNGREIARVTAPYMSNELALNSKLRR